MSQKWMLGAGSTLSLKLVEFDAGQAPSEASRRSAVHHGTDIYLCVIQPPPGDAAVAQTHLSESVPSPLPARVTELPPLLAREHSLQKVRRRLHRGAHIAPALPEHQVLDLQDKQKGII